MNIFLQSTGIAHRRGALCSSWYHRRKWRISGE